MEKEIILEICESHSACIFARPGFGRDFVGHVQRMAATSNCFKADFGHLVAALLERLQEWAKTNCSESAVVRNERGNAVLYARRGGEGKTAKSAKMMLRTVFQHWGASFDPPRDWLQLLNEGEYRAACETRPATPEQSHAATHQSMDEIGRAHV